METRHLAYFSLASAMMLFSAKMMGQAPEGGVRSIAETNIIAQANSDVNSLLKRLEEDPDNLGRDKDGRVIFLTLHSTNANDLNLSLVSTIESLKELTIQGRGWPASNRWTLQGISCLQRMTNLTSLRIMCQSVPEMNVRFLPAVSRLAGLRTLYLVAAPQEKQIYATLTNLQNLTTLHVSYDTNFGNLELSSLTNLPNLKCLELMYDSVTQEGTNVIAHMRGLTNASVMLKRH